MLRYEDYNPRKVNGRGSIVLAERTPFFQQAEEIARAGLAAGRKIVEAERRFYKTEQDFQEAKKRMESSLTISLCCFVPVLANTGRIA